VNFPNWHYEFSQGSEAWLTYRAGRITGTGVEAVMAEGSGTTRRAYLFKLMEEQDTGRPKKDKYTSQAMLNGKEREPDGQMAYENALEVIVESVSFIDHPTIPWFGVSPDGVQSTDPYRIGFELKSPELQTFSDRVTAVNRIRGARPVIDRGYNLQCHAFMECAALEAVDFCNYFPGYPPLIQRIYRDQKLIVDMKRAISLFQEELEEMRYTLKKSDFVWLEKAV